MSSKSHAIKVCLLLFGMTGGMVALAGSQTAPVAIAEPVISVSLDGASLDLVLVPAGQAGLLVVPVKGHENGGIVSQSDGRTFSVERQDDYQGLITLELRLAGDQQLQLVGRDLEVTAGGSPAWLEESLSELRKKRSQERRTVARQRRREASSARQAPDNPSLRAPSPDDLDGPPDLMRLELITSSLRFYHLANFEVIATDSNLLFRDTGLARVNLTGGRLASFGHRGALELDSKDAELEVEDTVGRVRASLNGGRLDLIGGRGAFLGSLNSSAVRLSERVGKSTLTGTTSFIEAASGSASARSELVVEGGGLEIVLAGYRGQFAADIKERSSLVARAVSGSMEVRADGESKVEIEQLEGPTQIGLSAGSQGRVVGLQGTLSAEIEDSTLDVVNVLDLELVVRAAGITAREIKNSFGIDALDSNLELDLRGIHGDPRLSLSGATKAQVLAGLPCQVGSDDPGAGIADWQRSQLEVTGCELHATGASSRRRSGLEGRLPILIRATLSEQSLLVVSGVPVR